MIGMFVFILFNPSLWLILFIPLNQVTGQPLSPSSQQAAQELNSGRLQTPTGQTQGTVQHAYLPSSWNYRSYCESVYSLLICSLQISVDNL